jgi:hypothetical protein
MGHVVGLAEITLVVSLSAAVDGEISGLVFQASSGLIGASRRCLFVAVSVRGGVCSWRCLFVAVSCHATGSRAALRPSRMDA